MYGSQGMIWKSLSFIFGSRTNLNIQYARKLAENVGRTPVNHLLNISLALERWRKKSFLINKKTIDFWNEFDPQSLTNVPPKILLFSNQEFEQTAKKSEKHWGNWNLEAFELVFFLLLVQNVGTNKLCKIWQILIK